MSYEKALECAGARVLDFENFGSYQGDWWALVEYRGQKGWVTGAFGSCSGCDAFEAEFGFTHSHMHDKEYVNVNDVDLSKKYICQECVELHNKLSRFGHNYLDNLLTQEEAEKAASQNLDWDSDATTMLEFIKDRAIK